MAKEYVCTFGDGTCEEQKIEAESAEDAARIYADRNYPCPSDKDIDVCVRDGDELKVFGATLEYEAYVFINGERGDDDE